MGIIVSAELGALQRSADRRTTRTSAEIGLSTVSVLEANVYIVEHIRNGTRYIDNSYSGILKEFTLFHTTYSTV